MGTTRFRLGKGFTIGSSGLRYGKRLGGVWVSSGKSGTLIAGHGVRHWAPGRRRGASPIASPPTPDYDAFTAGVVGGILSYGGGVQDDAPEPRPPYRAAWWGHATKACYASIVVGILCWIHATSAGVTHTVSVDQWGNHLSDAQLSPAMHNWGVAAGLLVALGVVGLCSLFALWCDGD